MKGITITAKYISELTEQDKINFFNVYCQIYSDDKKIQQKFEKKYLRNIYGESLIVFAYLNEKCVGIQAFLRNDIDGKEAYQSGDSVMLEECRRKGVFTAMVMEGIRILEKKAFIYGFPNNESLPAFKKMNWKIGIRMRYRLLKKEDKECVEWIDPEYFKWILDLYCNLYYIKRGEVYFILKKRKYNLYQIIGKVNVQDISENKLKRAFFPVILIYAKDGNFGNGMIPIWWKSSGNIQVPIYKMDTILTE